MVKKLDKIQEKKLKLQQKKLLLKLESEIKDLELVIKHIKFENTKIKALINLKILLRFGQRILPYTLSAAIVFGGMSVLGFTPFYINERKQKLNTKNEIDSFGKVRHEYQYKDYDEVSSIVTYYGKWEETENCLYKREIKKYKINEDIAVNAIEKIVKENNINSLEELLGKPYLEKTETKNNLSDNQINQISYLEALIYSEVENDYIIIKEPLRDEVISTVVFIVLSGICIYYIFKYRRENSIYDFGDCVSEIKERHPILEEDKLQKILKIRKENYDRLSR